MPARIELSQEEKDKIIELYQNGMSFNEIYKRYGYCNTVVKRTLDEKNIRIRDRLETRRKKEKIAEEKTEEKSEIKKPVNCNKIGNRCIHKTKMGNSMFVCDYIGHMGKMRGCEPTECTKYIFKGGRNGKTTKQS